MGAIVALRRAVCRTALRALWLGVCGALASQVAAAEPWDDDPAVREVLELRAKSIAAMTSGGPTEDSERYSTTFVANTPANPVVTGEEMRRAFARGAVSYAAVEQRLDYAGRHDLRHANVVAME